MKYKYILLTSAFALLCIADWCFSNFPIIDLLNKKIFSEYDIFMSLLDMTNGYNGLSELLIIYTIPVLFGIWYLSDLEESVLILRCKNRNGYKKMILNKLFLTGIGFAFIHEMIQCIFMVFFFECSFLLENHFLFCCTIMFITHSIFYIQTGFIYHIIGDLFHSKLVGVLAAFGINFVQFRILHSYNIWLPAQDSICGYMYMSGIYDLIDVCFITGKEILFCFVMYLICQIVFEKKDIIKNEKK